jgi:2-polyprenyl-6-methoxyphenol hydroxylase-like FAD-dependent oxidoreductase
METPKNVAIVLGGSLAGLLAAAAISPAVGHVVILEKGAIPGEPAARTGVPQGHHAHGLLSGAIDALDALLPGLVKALADSGCPTGDNLEDAAWIFGGKRLARGPSGVRGMTLARPILEHAVRRRVLALPNVEMRTEMRVTGLSLDGDVVTGVRCSKGASTFTEPASLAIDATGRTSRASDWLADAGFPRPPTDEVALDTHYVTRLYTRTPSQREDIAVLVVSSPECPRGGIALALDERTWIISQYALGGARPPPSPAAFAAFARTLPSRRLAELLEESEPIGEHHTLRFPSSIRRRFEDLSRMPRGLIVMGDALSSFNPTFGQGITVAALEARALSDLAPGRAIPGFEAEFQRRAARIVDVAWNASVGRTFLYDGVRGKPSLAMRLGNAYLPRVVAAAHRDPEIAALFMRTLHFVAPPSSLFAPRVLWRVLAARGGEVAPRLTDGVGGAPISPGLKIRSAEVESGR